MSKSISRYLERIGFVGVGATAGAAFALIAELTGHPWWALLIFLVCVFAPALLRPVLNFRTDVYLGRLRSSQRGRVLFVLTIIGATLATFLATGVNPRDYGYTPLLPPVVLASLLFGFGQGLFAVVVCTVAADYFFAPPEFDFAITNIEDAIGLAIFAVLGAFVALVIHGILPAEES